MSPAGDNCNAGAVVAFEKSRRSRMKSLKMKMMKMMKMKMMKMMNEVEECPERCVKSKCVQARMNIHSLRILLEEAHSSCCQYSDGFISTSMV